MLPTTVQDVPQSFFYNREATIEALQTLWYEVKLTDSVESMDMYKHYIQKCIKGDIAD